ncbi:hypothetical protein V1277_006412 [Bradyrhizobium sp. AZCC 1588]|uniref:hypothetical protein n=1 Tax=unclassified Bradyrhizobium TaxID=2631580 RepID=UPI002FF1D7E5
MAFLSLKVDNQLELGRLLDGQLFHDVDGKHVRGLVPDLNFVHGAGAPKSKIQFNGVGGLLTYISFASELGPFIPDNGHRSTASARPLGAIVELLEALVDGSQFFRSALNSGPWRKRGRVRFVPLVGLTMPAGKPLIWSSALGGFGARANPGAPSQREVNRDT